MKKISELVSNKVVKVPDRPKNNFVSYTPEYWEAEKAITEWREKYDNEGYLLIYRERLNLSASFVSFSGINADSSVFIKTLKEIADIFLLYQNNNLKVDFVYLKLSDFEKIIFGDLSLEAGNNQKELLESLKHDLEELKINLITDIREDIDDLKENLNTP